jgi:hypothetical protein
LRGRGYVILDARNNTAYGTLRTFLNMYVTWDTSGTTTVSAASATTIASPGAGNNRIDADRAFIQWAGFTFGRAQSFHDFFSSTGPYANLVNWGAPGTGATGWNVLAYTAQFGNGVSATLSMEDQRRRAVVGVSSTALPNAGAPAFGACTAVPSAGGVAVAPGTVPSISGQCSRAGQNLPALVGNIRVDQSWGSAQIMGAVQELRTLESAGSINSWGYSVGGGFTWNNPSAPGSQFGIQATWAKGATGYVAHSYTAHAILDGAAGGAAGSAGFLADGVVIGTTLHKTSAWSVNAGYQHRFNPNWAWTLHGAYTDIDYATGVDALCAVSGCFDFSFWSLGSRLLWTPVAGLNFGLDVMYHNFGSQAVAGAAPGIATLRDNDVWSAMLRVQRDF